MKKRLWYEKPADLWEEALPIGNGRIGGMVFSGAISDKIQINEDTLWSGYPGKNKGCHSIEEVEEIRKLIKEKKYVQAHKKTGDTMLGICSECYLSYGNLYIDIETASEAYRADGTDKNAVTGYSRKLDLTTAIVTTEYVMGGNKIKKEVFVSLKDDVMVIHIESENEISVQGYEAIFLENAIKVNENILVSKGRCPTQSEMYTKTVKYENEESIQFCSALKTLNLEKVCSGANLLRVEKSKDITFVFSVKTSFNGYDKMPVTEGRDAEKLCFDVLENISGYSYEDLKKRHIEEYKKYFDRVELEIDGEDFDNIPTDQRIKNAADGTVDNGLVTILFDYGRYLTIASSMEGSQPANLQGIWNDKLIAPWHSNYTMNINTQMNYWHTETCNLPECHMPLMEMLKEFSDKGNNFGLRGWSSWHNSDIWRFNYEATKGVLWGYWQMGGFWTLRHIWEHYIHTGDIKFLEEYYPVMVGATEFLEDWMFENEEGLLTTCPSTSPENTFVVDGEACAVCMGSAMDMGIIRDVFDKTIKAGVKLGKDTGHLKTIYEKLDTIKIGKDGRILEWGEELEEREAGHRHVSHLYFVFPSDIDVPEEYETAAKKSLEVRLENGGGQTGWSNAWIANLYARFKDGEKAMYFVRNMFKNSIYPNMFDAHPPFQIDGNFGICSAICEMLLQSHKGKIEMIPAIPKEWKSGRVKGLVARNGEKISFEWNEGKIVT